MKLIGRGSFGEVYEIERNIFGEIEKAALKVITIPQNASDIDEMYSDGYDEESITSTFQNHLKSIVAEYSMMRKMNGCANIVSCDDVRYVQHDDGIGWDIFIKMELLTPLTKALPTEVPEETVVKIAKDICAALELCKKHEIIHRDIKPQNIFVSPNGDYKLGDFGIAKTVERTMGGTKIGTYKYMAPEVYNNKPYGTAADIYSLGLVLYWLLNERRMPFLPLPPAKLSAGMDEQARNRRLSGEQFAEPKNGSEKLKAVVMKACACNVEDRYASASEMLMDLNQIGQEHSPQTNTVSAVSVPSAASVNRIESEDEDKTVGIFGKAVSDNIVIPDAQLEEGTVGLFFKPVIEAVDMIPVASDADSTEMKVVAATVQAEEVVEDTTAIAEKPKETSALEEKTDAELEFRRKEKQNPTENKPADSSTAQKQSKKKLLIIIGAVVTVLIAVMAILLPSMGKENTGNNSTIQNQDKQELSETKTTDSTESEKINELPQQTEKYEIESGKCGENITYQLFSNGELIISGQGKMDDYYDKNMPWNTHLDDIVFVNLRDGLINIGACAFSGCSNLYSVSIPATVECINMCAFEKCKKISEITIPDSVTYIGSHSFYGCDSLSSIVVPASVKEISNYAFSGGFGTENIYILNPECTIYDEGGTLGVAGTAVIHGFVGSTAEDYAKKYEYEFSAMVVSDMDIKRTYCLGDTLDGSTLGLEVVYENGQKLHISSGFTCTPAKVTTEGTQQVTVSFGDITESFDVEVLDFFSYEVDWNNPVDTDSGVGINEYSKRVNYRIMITARYRGNWVKSSSETDIEVNSSFANTDEGNWENAKNGKSSTWMFGSSSDSQGDSHWEGVGFVLPDNPAFAGDYSVTLFFGDLVKVVTFTLVYKGDYETGTGWSITNINWS